MSKIPTVVVYRDGEKARINQAEVFAWMADGWKTDPIAEPVQPEPVHPDADSVSVSTLDPIAEPVQPRKKSK